MAPWSEVSDVSDGRLPSIIVIYSQYHGTRGCCNDALGRDGVHRGNPTPFEEARRGAEKSRIKPGRMYRRVAGCSTRRERRKIGKFPARKHGLPCKLFVHHGPPIIGLPKLTPVSLHPIIFTATQMHVDLSSS